MRINWSKTLLFFILIMSIGILYASNFKNKTRIINEVKVSINPKSDYFISADSVRSLVNEIVSYYKDSVDILKIEKLIDSNTYVEKSQVFKTVGDQLKIVVKQKTPIARIITSDSIFYLDKNSNFMSLSNLHSVEVPIIFGYTELSDLDYLTKISLMIKNDDFLNERISQIFINDKQNIGLKLRGYKTIVEIGDSKSLENKVQNLKAFYNRAFKKDEIGKYKKLNLQFDNQVVGIK